MHHIDLTRLPELLLQRGIYPLNDEPIRRPSTARPALPHWSAAQPEARPADTNHDFLVVGIMPG